MADSGIVCWKDEVKGHPVWLAFYPAVIDFGETRDLCWRTCKAWALLGSKRFDAFLEELPPQAGPILEATVHRLGEFGDYVNRSTLRKAPNGAPYILSSTVPTWRLP